MIARNLIYQLFNGTTCEDYQNIVPDIEKTAKHFGGLVIHRKFNKEKEQVNVIVTYPSETNLLEAVKAIEILKIRKIVNAKHIACINLDLKKIIEKIETHEKGKITNESAEVI